MYGTQTNTPPCSILFLFPFSFASNFFPSFLTMSSIIFLFLSPVSYYLRLLFSVLFAFHQFLSNSHVFYVPVHSAIAVNCGTRFEIAIVWHQFIINATTRSTQQPFYSLLILLLLLLPITNDRRPNQTFNNIFRATFAQIYSLN